MYIISLKFSNNKSSAGQHIQAHKDWVEQGFNDAIFLVSGSLQPNLGGGIIAHNCTLDEITTRVNADPFVANDVVTAEILELSPVKASKPLEFLLA